MPVTRNDAARRFEVVEDGKTAVLTFREVGDRLELVHVGVPDALGGRGIGGALVEAALADADARHLTVVPACPFVRTWLERHPEEAARHSIAG